MTLEDFKEPVHTEDGLHCLNHLVTDALRHVPDCLEYLAGAKDLKVFNFVSIPQVMAIATLAECYNNPQVFRGKVKVRRGITAKLVMRSTNMRNIYKIFYQYAVFMRDRIPVQDPSALQTRQVLDTIIAKCVSYVPMTPDLTIANRLSLLLFALLSAYLLHRRKENAGEGTIWRRGGVPQACDVLAVAAFFGVMIYLLTFFGLQFVKPQYSTERNS
ncbi:farnesyl-diphosphate farnesyltransferase [Galdieria sulphuraria]|uniref:Farnesyl-diphosphate farnesyltransferase n=1 Tax=Galdieria sulphuraria TaxID=130081 RepID=M2X845_GALSU|nr:farnesyl-diphosphate farnesyltransferase [Galdieria sulphuraria]EME32730.1 farnesyl-diphosphate farnesyltransferase [Galdieria sulphuraria]|eukprot:XP_005709250.1 farnesyl-diphosphate farnesyltransferase [Galdieria sulphuraria]